MSLLPSTDLLIGAAATAVAAVAIYLFIRASGGWSRMRRTESVAEVIDKAPSLQPSPLSPRARESGFQLPQVEHHLRPSDVEQASSNLRTLTIQRELLSMVLKRLFEAEDDGEITREERLSLSKSYETEMKKLSEELKRAELTVALHELESIRDDIMKRFEATLNETQLRIDSILKELKPEVLSGPARAPKRRMRPEKKEEGEEEGGKEDEGEEEEAEEEKLEPRRRRKSEVEEKVEQLRKEVLKELEELEKLEIEV